MRLEQRKIKVKPRIKLNHNMDTRLACHPHDDFVAVKMCHSPNPTSLGFMHMQVYCDIFVSRAVIRPERAE